MKKKIKLPIYNNEVKIVLNALNEFRNIIIPVSYTHLDVYKRQEYQKSTND